MKLFENEYYQINLDQETPCLEWIGGSKMTSKEFRESEEKSLDYFKKFRSKHSKLEWFVDARDVGLISTEDTTWVVDKILPKFAEAGLRKEAFVVPESALGKLIVKNYVSKAGLTIEIKIFASVDEAKSWLKE